MKIYSVIHARGGSKRIPLKNLKLLNKKPLLAYPIELAKSISLIKKIIVSSDHPEIIELSKDLGAEAPFIRPPEISEDVASELVTLHCLNWLKEKNDLPDIMVTLTPATPFTKKAELNQAINLLLSNPKLDTVITIRKAKEHPEWIIDLDENGVAKTLLGNNFDGKYNISQNLKKYYYPMGAFFVNRVSSFLKKPSMYGDNWGCIELNPLDSIDIDNPDDWDVAENMAQKFAL
jgi:N-acylneuraminate cytidylyltransferase